MLYLGGVDEELFLEYAQRLVHDNLDNHDNPRTRYRNEPYSLIHFIAEDGWKCTCMR